MADPTPFPPVYVRRVLDVQPHGDATDRVTLGEGVTNVANRLAYGTPRYGVGDYAIVLHDGLILPEALLRHLDMWNHEKNKGGLAGNKGNRTKARNFDGVMSTALCAIDWEALPKVPVGESGLVTQAIRVTIPMVDYNAAMTFERVVDASEPEEFTPDGLDVGEMISPAMFDPNGSMQPMIRQAHFAEPSEDEAEGEAEDAEASGAPLTEAEQLAVTEAKARRDVYGNRVRQPILDVPADQRTETQIQLEADRVAAEEAAQHGVRPGRANTHVPLTPDSPAQKNEDEAP